MRRTLILTISFVAVVVSAIVSAAGASSVSNAGNAKQLDKSAPALKISGKVTKVDVGSRTFTINARGHEHTFVVAKPQFLPKVGESIEVSYTQTFGGPMQAINLNSSRSNIY